MCYNNQAGAWQRRITEAEAGAGMGAGVGAGAGAGARTVAIAGVKVTHGNSHKMTLSVSFN